MKTTIIYTLKEHRMYKLKTNIELPIAISTKWEGSKLPTLYGFNYIITITVESENLDKNNMVIDFKQLKKVIHEYFDQYDHSMILTPDNPIVDIYKSTGFEYDKLHIWDENPTAEYMSKYWRDVLTGKFKELKPNSVEVEVEETSHNSVSCTN